MSILPQGGSPMKWCVMVNINVLTTFGIVSPFKKITIFIYFNDWKDWWFL